MPDALPSSTTVIRGAPQGFHLQALLQIALQTRGVPCHQGSPAPLEGAYSFTVSISFDDGVQWIAKCPIRYGRLVSELRKKCLESEVATMRLVRSHTTIPVPEVFAWDSSDDNPVCSAYILMSYATGKILFHCGWYSWYSRECTESMTVEQKCKVYSQLGGIVYQLSTLRFPKIGSIFGSDTDAYIEECLRIQTLEYGRAERGVPRGPFTSSMDYYTMLADVLGEEVLDDNLYIGVFFDVFPRPEQF